MWSDRRLLYFLLGIRPAGVVVAFSKAISPISNGGAITTSTISSSVRSPAEAAAATNAVVVMPIFPLRQSVRFPTDPLTLNLYEERYLAMAERILQQQPNNSDDLIFGALYVSDKAHIVPESGWGPIVPLLQRGDVGTLFKVNHSESAMIPTQGGERRKRIRLDSIGIRRFQVQAILHDGMSKDGEPYILAEASYYHDEEIETPSELKNMEKRVDELYNNLLEMPLPKKQDKASLLVRHGISDPDLEQQSFALASLLMERCTAKEKLSCLECRSIAERLQKLCRMESRQRSYKVHFIKLPFV